MRKDASYSRFILATARCFSLERNLKVGLVMRMLFNGSE
jgi:hypothetical protein